MQNSSQLAHLAKELGRSASLARVTEQGKAEEADVGACILTRTLRSAAEPATRQPSVYNVSLTGRVLAEVLDIEPVQQIKFKRWKSGVSKARNATGCWRWTPHTSVGGHQAHIRRCPIEMRRGRSLSGSQGYHMRHLMSSCAGPERVVGVSISLLLERHEG